MSEIRQFTTDKTTIYWGDVIEVLQTHIPNQSVNLIFADPPYNIGKKFGDFIDKWDTEASYLAWCYQWLDLCLQKLTPNGSLYLMASTQAMPYLDIYLREKIHVLSRIIWAYDSSGVQAKNHFGSSYEPILYGVMDDKNYTFNGDSILVEAKTGAKRGLIDYRKSPPTPYSTTKVPSNVWQFPRVRYRMPEYEDHPTQKPLALLDRIIQASSHIGDTVLDLFSGTFTTSYVAQQLDRKSIGIELQQDYIKIGLRRLGIQSELDGELLTPMVKSYQTPISSKQKRLWDDS
ncbi:MAG TPA: adenine-specific DNA-methyltransferase [Aggregatilineales bacterium]|nr:adenine-specific DNA-methyltransferase [Aggregatilineales bacterium]